MPQPFSLFTTRWLPVRGGALARIAPHEITLDHDDDPVMDFAWPRPDFDVAAHEFLIGLLAAAFPPKSVRDWLRLYQSPPSPDELAAAFAPYAAAFTLDGAGQRFLQDLSRLEGEATPVESLFIEAPGANTIKLNKDLLIKRGRVTTLSRASAAMALYALQQFAPSGGQGHRTSLRGGGPLTTLVLPGPDLDGRPASLWRRLWLHVPQAAALPQESLALAFPWLAPTKTSEKNQRVSLDDADPRQAFFGMPRRIRLVFEKNGARAPCDLSGEIDEVVVRQFVMKPYGVNYGVFPHPLTPYYKVKTDRLPVHAPEGGLGYRQWLGLVYDAADGTRIAATAVVEARKRLGDCGGVALAGAKLFAAGFSMDNMKALAFAEALTPLHAVADETLAEALRLFSESLIKASSTLAYVLGLAVADALFDPKARPDVNVTLIEAARERFWAETDRAFHDLLTRAATALSAEEAGDAQLALAEGWRALLQRCASGIFDSCAPFDGFGQIDPERVVRARAFLVRSCRGFGKMGRALYASLALPPPEDAKKERKSRERAPA